MQALSKITGGVIPSSSTYRLNHKVSDGPVSGQEFKANLQPRFDKLAGRDQQPDICYRAAVHAARAGNAITKDAEKALNEGKNYPPSYLKLMGISDQSKRLDFNSTDIPESGFLNFHSATEGRLVHTAYVHKDPDGRLLLAHNNGLSLDRELGMPERTGGVNVHDITTGHDGDINRYLSTNKLSFHYSPASEVNGRA